MRFSTSATALIAANIVSSNAFIQTNLPKHVRKNRYSFIDYTTRKLATEIDETIEGNSVSYSDSSQDMNTILFNDVDDTSTKIEKVRDSFGFRNDGKYWFMKTLLGFYQEGSSLVNGVPTKKSDSSIKISDDEAKKRREKAIEELVNIDFDERQRRINSGNIALTLAALYAVYMTWFVDQGDAFGHVVRFSVYPLFATGYGLRESGKAGLWNVAQTGLWDVDGNGLSRIEDRSLALSLLEKVNMLNDRIFFSSIIPVIIFASVSSLTASIATGLVVFGAIFYTLEKKFGYPE